MAELAIRTVFSLAVVLGLLLVLTRVAGRKYRGKSGAVRVVQRQALSRGTAVTVVEVGRRTLVLGVTEQQVQVLAELEHGELDGVDHTTGEGDEVPIPIGSRKRVTALPAPRAATPAFADQLLVEIDLQRDPAPGPDGPPDGATRSAGRHRAAPERPTPTAGGALAGSLLSPQTWRQGWQVIGRRAS